jgi:hypothetical protein
LQEKLKHAVLERDHANCQSTWIDFDRIARKTADEIRLLSNE